jgi:hypothetical protein
MNNNTLEMTTRLATKMSNENGDRELKEQTTFFVMRALCERHSTDVNKQTNKQTKKKKTQKELSEKRDRNETTHRLPVELDGGVVVDDDVEAVVVAVAVVAVVVVVVVVIVDDDDEDGVVEVAVFAAVSAVLNATDATSSQIDRLNNQSQRRIETIRTNGPAAGLGGVLGTGFDVGSDGSAIVPDREIDRWRERERERAGTNK